MRNYLIVMVATMCLGMSLASVVRAQNFDWRAQQKQLKLQQKRERNALKAQQRYIKSSWKGSQVPNVTRSATMHQMQHQLRDLKLRQKDAMQALKDQQKASKTMQRAYVQ